MDDLCKKTMNAIERIMTLYNTLFFFLWDQMVRDHSNEQISAVQYDIFHIDVR